MSWLDELSELERRARARLAELEPQVARIEPLMAEYDDVTQLLARLSRERAASQPAAESPAAETAVTATAAATPAPPAARKRAARTPAAKRKPAARTRAARKPTVTSTAAKPAAGRSRSARRRPTAARPGERERQLLEMVAARPGITVPEVAQELGVDATGVYGIVRRLSRKGQLSKEGTGLKAASSAAEAAVSVSSAA